MPRKTDLAGRIRFSLLASATRVGVEPFAWLTDVLTQMAAGPMEPAQLRDLLPDVWTVQHLVPTKS